MPSLERSASRRRRTRESQESPFACVAWLERRSSSCWRRETFPNPCVIRWRTSLAIVDTRLRNRAYVYSFDRGCRSMGHPLNESVWSVGRRSDWPSRVWPCGDVDDDDDNGNRCSCLLNRFHSLCHSADRSICAFTSLQIDYINQWRRTRVSI